MNGMDSFNMYVYHVRTYIRIYSIFTCVIGCDRKLASMLTVAIVHFHHHTIALYIKFY